MKNVLFVGPYRQNDGWGNAAKEYLRALRLADCNLAARPVYLNMQSKYAESDEFKDLEEVRYDAYDVVIQNCLPNMFRRYGGVKNIGLAYFETSDISCTPWPESINLLDQMWVSSAFERQTLLKSNVLCEIAQIPIPTDASKYEKEYLYKDLGRDYEFKFYFVGEYISRKDINSLLLAFHREFNPSEQVRLVLKLNKVGADPSALLNEVKQSIYSFKRAVKFQAKPSLYKEEIVIPVYLSDEDLYGLHSSCDCFVMPSSGEAFCMPAFDALMFGNYPLVNANSSMIEYLREGLGQGIESHEIPAIAPDRPLPYLYTGQDTWYQVDPIDLQRQMRKVFNNREAFRQQKAERQANARKLILPNYTYQSVAKQISEVL